MSRRVRVSDQAKSGLDEIWDYVARKQSIDAATRLIDSIASRFPMLGKHPDVGRH
jgi:plasmid stabilization system protein ParE